jgi:hypothetical protein
LDFSDVARLYATHSRVLCKKLILPATVPHYTLRPIHTGDEIRYLHAHTGLRSLAISERYSNSENGRQRSFTFARSASQIPYRLLSHIHGSSLRQLCLSERFYQRDSDPLSIDTSPTFAALFPNLKVLELIEGFNDPTPQIDEKWKSMLRQLPMGLDTLVLATSNGWPPFDAIPPTVTSLTLNTSRVVLDYADGSKNSVWQVVKRLHRRFPNLVHLSIFCPNESTHSLNLPPLRANARQQRPVPARRVATAVPARAPILGGPSVNPFSSGASSASPSSSSDPQTGASTSSTLENGQQISQSSPKVEPEHFLDKLQNLELVAANYSSDLFRIIESCPSVIALSITASSIQLGSPLTPIRFPPGLSSLKVVSRSEADVALSLAPGFFTQLPPSLLSLHFNQTLICFGPMANDQKTDDLEAYKQYYPAVDPEFLNVSYLALLPSGLRSLTLSNVIVDLNLMPPHLERLVINRNFGRAAHSKIEGRPTSLPRGLKELELLSGCDFTLEEALTLPPTLTKFSISLRAGYWTQTEVAALMDHLTYCKDATLQGQPIITLSESDEDVVSLLKKNNETIRMHDVIIHHTRQFGNRVRACWLVPLPDVRLVPSASKLAPAGAVPVSTPSSHTPGSVVHHLGPTPVTTFLPAPTPGFGFGASTAPTDVPMVLTQHHFRLPSNAKHFVAHLTPSYQPGATFALEEGVLKAHIESLLQLQTVFISATMVGFGSSMVELDAFRSLAHLTRIELQGLQVRVMDFRFLPRSLLTFISPSYGSFGSGFGSGFGSYATSTADPLKDIPGQSAQDLPRGIEELRIDDFSISVSRNVIDWPTSLHTLVFTSSGWNDFEVLALKQHLTKLKLAHFLGSVTLTDKVGDPSPSEKSESPVRSLQNLLRSTVNELAPLVVKRFVIGKIALDKVVGGDESVQELAIKFDPKGLVQPQNALQQTSSYTLAYTSQAGPALAPYSTRAWYSIAHASAGIEMPGAKHGTSSLDSGYPSYSSYINSLTGYGGFGAGPAVTTTLQSCLDPSLALNATLLPKTLTSLTITAFDATSALLSLLPTTLTLLEIVAAGTNINMFHLFPRSLETLIIHTEDAWNLTRSGIAQLPPQLRKLNCNLLCFPTSLIEDFPAHITDLTISGGEMWTDYDVKRLGDHLAQGKGGLSKLNAKRCLVSGSLIQADPASKTGAISSATTALSLDTNSNPIKELTMSKLKDLTNLALGGQYSVEWSSVASPLRFVSDETEIINLKDAPMDIVPRYLVSFPSRLTSLTLTVTREIGRSDFATLPHTLTYLNVGMATGCTLGVHQWFWATLPPSLQFLSLIPSSTTTTGGPSSFPFSLSQDPPSAFHQEHTLVGIPFHHLHTLIVPWLVIPLNAMENLGPNISKLHVHSFNPPNLETSVREQFPKLQLTISGLLPNRTNDLPNPYHQRA